MSPKISRELAEHRLEQAKEEVVACEALYDLKLYKSANNRAYYSIFHSIRAVLALEPIDFKKHKDVIAYFNKNYIHTGVFPNEMSRKIAKANKIREDSDYVDEFIVKEEETKEQLDTAKTLIKLVEQYIMKNGTNNE